jgi:predicted hydrocarbon binding protein
MRVEDLDIDELLELDPEQGTIRFAGARAILLDAGAMGLLRKQLTETFGSSAARAIFTRFGYAHGWRMAEAMDQEIAWDRREDWQAAGGRIHQLQGLLKLLPGGGPMAPEGARVAASYEAEQHLLHLGRSATPVCWTLTGFASGYLSRTEGQDIYVLEKRCLGRGDAACHSPAPRRRGARSWRPTGRTSRGTGRRPRCARRRRRSSGRRRGCGGRARRAAGRRPRSPTGWWRAARRCGGCWSWRGGRRAWTRRCW